MEDKYYQPSIEEFHVGFECESNYILINNSEKDKSKFIQFTFTRDNLAYMIDAYVEDAYPNEFRVKYLDSEDIESLGFKKTINGQYYFEDDDFECTLLIDSDMFVQIIIDGGYLFQGTIKNKSELARLLKQLNITK